MFAGDQAGRAGGGDDDLRARDLGLAGSRVRRWQTVTVQCSRISSSWTGLPTTLLRPITTARLPSSVVAVALGISTAASAQAGRNPS